MKNAMRSGFMTNAMFAIILVFWIIITNNTMAACSFQNGFNKKTVTLLLPNITKLPGDKTLTTDEVSVDARTLYGADFSEVIAACTASETMVTGNSSYTVKDTILETNVAGVKLYGSPSNNHAYKWRYPSSGDNYVSKINNSGRITPTSIGGAGMWGSGAILYVRREVEPMTQGGIVNGGLVFNMSTSDGLDIIDVYIGSFAVTVPTCTVNKYDKAVDLGTLYTQQMNFPGSVSSAKDFSINMTCASTSLTPTVTFVGEVDSNYPTVLVTNAGDATGVGVQLLYGGGPIVPGTAVSLGRVTTSTSSRDYNFQARAYQTSSSVTAGGLDFTATFTIDYE